MRNDILQSLFRGLHIRRGKHKQTIEQTCQMNILSRGFNHLDVCPAVFSDSSICVDADLRTDLDTDHLTRLAYGMNEVWEAAARSATDIENTIARS